MSLYNQPLPIPYIQIDKEGNILTCSGAASRMFDLPADNIVALADVASKEKLVKFIVYQEEPCQFEVNLRTKTAPAQLFDIHLSWDGQANGHIALLPKDQQNEHLEERLLSLQNRLSSTNFELLAKKEELERALIRLRELSGPFIALSPTLAFIPLFGDITREKMESITKQALHTAYEGEYTHIAVDFTAVGQIEEEGVDKLLALFTMLQYMNGAKIEVVGMKPQHSQMLHSFHREWPFAFSPSLAYVLHGKDK
ncbi:STAS domain-containing protein [Pseudobacillus badius]|uniref:hypothetical protein n=1 Tax=Bacillus badius TaxID=1455 RepID=UPI0007B0A75C|nr:hypothetical protein [Bacillus badius]KZN98547.1 hypothetical protein A4244_09555 [Bacillus badius]MED0666207.1 Stressosome protein rsbRB [Bacillus badius]OCS83244.1 hypothetical protein A6M11_09565 [Bacillus badius]OVE51620.1 hypothetical protein B1A98_11290 [Bacillus badius]TDW02865.1 anti-anti-sigma regulatory factor [Bacillus badius]